jgi:hypothetical protein
MKTAIKYGAWTLEHEDGTPAYVGEVCTSRGESYALTGGRPPHKPASTGRVWTDAGEYFPSVFDLKWVEFKPTPLPDSVPRTPATQEMYVDSMGLRCPHCGSEAISGGEINIDAGVASQEVECDECNARWHDLYTLTGYATISKE